MNAGLEPGPQDDPLTDDWLTADFRVLQRKRGHRYSLDDVATAGVAVEVARRELLPIDASLDLGCGLGSVLLMVGWCLPAARLVGVEAQAVSFDLLNQNVRRNGLAHRAELHHGDLRDVELRARLGRFDLITGTPPYQPPGTATPSPDSQRAHARMELRGGVEEYITAAAELLSDRGRFVVCAEGSRPERVLETAAQRGLHVLAERSVWPREGRPGPLFCVFTLGRASASGGPRRERFVARDVDGARSSDYLALRRLFGLPRQDV